MKSLRGLAVVATVLAGSNAGCTDEPEEASSFSSSLPNYGSETAEPLTDSSGGSTAGTAPTTAPTGSGSGDGDESTSDSASSGGTSGGSTGPGTTTGSSGPDDTGGTGPVVGGCGNGTLDMNEQCDGMNLNGFTCESLGNSGGTLLCDAVTCTFDTSLCTNDTSGGTSG